MPEAILIDDLLSDLHDRIEFEIERRHEFNSRELARDLVEILNIEDPELLSTLAGRLIENEVMRQVDNIAREKRTRAQHRLRRASAVQAKWKLLTAVDQAISTEQDQEKRREAVISAARNLWNQSVTVEKNKRIRLKACTEEDLEYLANRFTRRAQSFGRNALFYSALRQLVIDNDVNTVGELPETALEKAASELDFDDMDTQ